LYRELDGITAIAVGLLLVSWSVQATSFTLEMASLPERAEGPIELVRRLEVARLAAIGMKHGPHVVCAEIAKQLGEEVAVVRVEVNGQKAEIMLSEKRGPRSGFELRLGNITLVIELWLRRGS